MLHTEPSIWKRYEGMTAAQRRAAYRQHIKGKADRLRMSRCTLHTLHAHTAGMLPTATACASRLGWMLWAVALGLCWLGLR